MSGNVCKVPPELTGVQGQRQLKIHTLTGDTPGPPRCWHCFWCRQNRSASFALWCRCTTWRGLLHDRHRFARYFTALLCETFLEGCFEVKSNKDSGVISLREVLDGLPTPYCKGPAHSATDSFFAAINDLSASLRRNDIMKSGLWPPVGLASGVICPPLR